MEKVLQLEKIDIRIRWGFLVALLLSLLCYVLTLFNNNRLKTEQKKVEHTYEVLTNLSALFSSTKDVETGARGFLLYKKDSFLLPYKRGLYLIDSFKNTLQKLTVDNKNQTEKIQHLLPMINGRVSLLQFIVKDFTANNLTITDTILQLKDKQLALMTAVRDKVKEIRDEEYRLLELRKMQTQTSGQWLDRVIFFSLLFSIGIAVFGFITYKKEHNERKKAYQRIEDYQNTLKMQVDELRTKNIEIVRMRSQEKFASTGRIARQIAHEVRNPLTNINLATNQLIEDLNSNNEEVIYLFDMIKRNSNRINDLIADLLKSTKFAELSFSKKNINELLEDTLALSQDRLALHKVKLEKNFDKSLPLISVDEGKLKIALLNIIINGIEAMEQMANAKLTIVTKRENEKIVICITDTGKGMDEEVQSKLFEPYFTNKHKGNGLGLTNSQNIILNHKGDITVASNPDVGTTFIVKLNME